MTQVLISLFCNHENPAMPIPRSLLWAHIIYVLCEILPPHTVHTILQLSIHSKAVKCQLTKRPFNKTHIHTAPHLNTIIHTKTCKHAAQWIRAGQSAPLQKPHPHTFINRILLYSVETHCILVFHFTKWRPFLSPHPCNIVQDVLCSIRRESHLNKTRPETRHMTHLKTCFFYWINAMGAFNHRCVLSLHPSAATAGFSIPKQFQFRPY